MLEKIFLQILNMSFTASVVIIFVLIARQFLKKSPKIFSYVLWVVVLFRLIIPFSFEGVYSLIPTKVNPIPQEIGLSTNPTIDTGVTVINNSVNYILPTPIDTTASVNPLQIWIFIGYTIWIFGIIVMLTYSLVSLIKLLLNLKNTTLYKDNIFISTKISTPFIIGIINPKIYLPCNLSDTELNYIILHEKTHIKRLDHIVKIISFFTLCIHWFNPFVWIAFSLSSLDMEMSCDEIVIKKLGNNLKKDYSTSLLTLATGRSLGPIPLAFSEGDTKNRVKNILNYKKPTFWVVILTLILVLALSIGLIANPKNNLNKFDLPLTNSANKITITHSQSDYYNEIVNPAAINSIYNIIYNSKKTDNITPNETPVNIEDFYLINLHNSEFKTFYMYSGYNSYFIDFPYAGIYEISLEDYNSLLEIKKDVPNDVIELWNKRTDYVGNNSDVGNIINSLGFLWVKNNGFELDTDGNNRKLIINLEDTNTQHYTYEQYRNILTNTLYLFALIGNLEEVEYNSPNKEPFYFNIKWADDYVSGNIKSYGDTLENFYQLFSNHNMFDDTLSIAVHNEIIGRSGLSLNKQIESNIVITTEVIPSTSVTVYTMALYGEYDIVDNTIVNVLGSHGPIAITFSMDNDGGYTLIEYWEPNDGSEYMTSIKNKFPESISFDDIDTQKYILAQLQSNYAQLIELGYVDADIFIEKLISDIVDLQNNKVTFSYLVSERSLTYYGNYMLQYTAKNLTSNTNREEALLMENACREILEQTYENLVPTSETGYDWLVAQNTLIDEYIQNNGIDFVMTNFPSGYILYTTE